MQRRRPALARLLHVTPWAIIASLNAALIATPMPMLGLGAPTTNIIAKELLKTGKDPEMNKLAEDIIAAQGKEIKVLNDWIAKQAKEPAK